MPEDRERVGDAQMQEEQKQVGSDDDMDEDHADVRHFGENLPNVQKLNQ